MKKEEKARGFKGGINGWGFECAQMMFRKISLSLTELKRTHIISTIGDKERTKRQMIIEN